VICCIARLVASRADISGFFHDTLHVLDDDNVIVHRQRDCLQTKRSCLLNSRLHRKSRKGRATIRIVSAGDQDGAAGCKNRNTTTISRKVIKSVEKISSILGPALH
jgi:hypothetical protein